MSTIIMILLISVLILVHEAGHFFSARLFKMKVDKFGIGLPIGPTLYEKKIGDITFLIHAFLFGGYVSFPDDDKDSDIPQDSYERISNRPIWQRAIVFSAGVISNVICAYVLVLLTAGLWQNLPSGKFDIYVKEISAPKEASVWQSGLQNGDKVVEIKINDKGVFADDELLKEEDEAYSFTFYDDLIPVVHTGSIISNVFLVITAILSAIGAIAGVIIFKKRNQDIY